MDPRDWSDEIIYQKGYTNILLRHFRNKKGEADAWGMVHITSRGRGAVVLAITTSGEVILERSLRIPIKGEVIELPGGLNDMEHESPQVVAARELLEETGYGGGVYEEVAVLAESPGITDQECVLYIARGVHAVTAPALGAAEVIAPLLIPIQEVKAFLKKAGLPIDPKVLAALAFLPEAQ
jgi:ADP-ribose pyrophosphatase